MSWHVIRKVPIVHCARGPQRCAKCKAVSRSALCLLDVNPPRAEMQARPVIGVNVEGTKVYRPYDIVREFATREEAEAWARDHGIADASYD